MLIDGPQEIMPLRIFLPPCTLTPERAAENALPGPPLAVALPFTAMLPLTFPGANFEVAMPECDFELAWSAWEAQSLLSFAGIASVPFNGPQRSEGELALVNE